MFNIMAGHPYLFQPCVVLDLEVNLCSRLILDDQVQDCALSLDGLVLSAVLGVVCHLNSTAQENVGCEDLSAVFLRPLMFKC